jgi:uncharacterized alpha-E superfamily protein
VERAENLVRFLEVSQSVALDMANDAPSVWLSLIDACADRSLFEDQHPEVRPDQVVQFLLAQKDNPNAIHNCIAIARENARQTREVIPNEFFEELNALYLDLNPGSPSGASPCRSSCSRCAGVVSSCTASLIRPCAAT